MRRRGGRSCEGLDGRIVYIENIEPDIKCIYIQWPFVPVFCVDTCSLLSDYLKGDFASV